MTLKEKMYFDCRLNTHEQAEKNAKIADDYAIEFGNWLNNQVITVSGRHHNLLGTTKVTQLLPIFKKEKGL
jgi:hypothetical protein